MTPTTLISRTYRTAWTLYTQRKIHNRNGDRRQIKLPRHKYPHNPHRLENFYITETHFHRPDHPILLQPPSPTKIRCRKVPIQQDIHIQAAWRRIQNRRKHHPHHHVQQRLPDPPRQPNSPKENHNSQQPDKHNYTQMGYVYLRWQTDDLHHQLVQKDSPDNSTTNQ